MFTEKGEKLKNAIDQIPWDRYPRPLLKRDSFLNLCGWWRFRVKNMGEGAEPGGGKIRVPFVPESELSEIHMHFPENAELIYEREVEIPEGFRKKRLLLHIDGADQHAKVFVDGILRKEHDGGYEHFTADITDVKDHFTLRVSVRDDLTDKAEPYGKQRIKRGGMWYTPFSGLWQPVWIESVEEEYVRSLRIRTDMEQADIDTGDASHFGEVWVKTPMGGHRFSLAEGKCHVRLPAEEIRLWSPEDPYLYDYHLKLKGGDEIDSYFALRKVECGYDKAGVPRVLLNGKPYFFHGLLDQGYFSDGLCTPADPSVYADDIRSMKDLGFNTLRKHIRVEPDLFYAECDRIGMIVFQDMVNNGSYSFFRDTALPNLGLARRNDRNLHRDQVQRETFLRRMEETVEQLGSFPCILYWTIFNEGWGQFDSRAVCERLRRLDPDRIIDAASGWYDQGAGDVKSIHVYHHKYRFEPSKKPVIVSECGGYALPVPGHLNHPKKVYGYGRMKSAESFSDKLDALYYGEIIPVIEKGLCGSIYTQVSDVEDEINGILTYDRKVRKPDRDRMMRIAEEIAAAIKKTKNNTSREA